MDRYSGKSSSTRVMTPKKGCNIGSKDATTERDGNGQFCNRIGCSGRIKYITQNTKIGISEKDKCSSASLCSSNGNEMTGKSSRSSCSTTKAKASIDSKRKLSSRLESKPSESSHSEAQGLTRLHSRSSVNKSREITVPRIGSSSVASNVRSQKKSGSNNQSTRPVSSNPSISKNSFIGKHDSTNSSRHNTAPSSSSSESKSSERNVMKKRSSEGESSSSRRGRQTVDSVGFSSTNSVSISRSCSKRSSSASGKDNNSAVASVRSQRSMNVNNSRTRHSSRENGRNGSSLREPAVQIPQEIPFNIGWVNSPWLSPTDDSSSASSSLLNRDAFRRYNMDGITEVLLALERIEWDQRLTNEQVLSLEESLFLSGLNLSDQHRDMRLDIDNMSYEELLALQDSMGTVSTALPEEALVQCISISEYQTTPPSQVRVTGSVEDGVDTKCSICQEEYVEGDEVGKLVECQHEYHTTCINQWLRLKNWCPICKAEAAPPAEQ